MKRSILGLAALAATSVLLVGCTPATGTPEADDAALTLDDAQSACVETVQADVDAAKEPLELIAPTAPLDLPALAGKTVWYVTVSMNQFSTDMAQGVTAAAEAAGMSAVLYDGQGSANRYNEGVQQAIAQGADGIILMGIDPSLVSNALADAAAAGIPVQSTLNGDPDAELAPSIYGNFTSDYTADGALGAKWAMADSGCQADIIMLSSSTVTVWNNMAEGAAAEIEASCPECSIEVLNIDLANTATDVGSQLQTALQRNPEANYIFPAWDSAVPYIAPVVAAANSDAKVLGRDGIEASLEMIAGDTGQDFTLAMPTTAWIGWAALDDLAREMTGAELSGTIVPTRVIDSSNIGDGSAATISPEYVDYEAAFTTAWAGN